MVHSKEKAIRARVLVPLTLTFLVLLATFLYSGYNIRQQAMDQAFEHRHGGVKSLFTELQKQRIGLLAATLQFISHQPSLQAAMIRGERTALLDISKPLFEELKAQHGITHFYFHDISGKNFLRVHRPEHFGDQIDRLTLKQARETKQMTNGLELGILGTYTLRVVVPWYDTGNQLIGYIELGEEVDQILRKLKEVTHTDFLVTINKEFLQRDRWEQGMAMLQRPADWGLLATRVIINQTIDVIPHALEKKIFWDYQNDAHYHTDTADNHKSYQIKAFPLYDVAENRIGDFVMLLDISPERAGFVNFMLRIGAFSLLLCLALFTFSFKTLGRMDQALSKAGVELYDQIDKADMLNKQLKIEIVERKRAEEELKVLNTTLEKRISERTRKLERLNSEIEAHRRDLEKAYEDLKLNQMTILHQDKMANIGQLAAGVAHDINNPIGFVANNLSELDSYIKDLCLFLALQDQTIAELRPDEKQIRMLSDKRSELQIDEMIGDLDDIIQESLEGTQRVNKIVQNLRDFSRLDEDDYELADIHECLDSTINISGNELRYKAEVVRHYGDIPQIFCYPGQLNQVFMNLLINAAQSMQDYGQIEISTWQQDDSVFVRFTDTGSGMSEEVRDRIFEPFFTTKEVGTGTGLGLSITYDIIKRHDGDIRVESELGKGTTFVIRLPAEQRKRAET
jgi:signal transduction histidine kinase